MFEFHIYDHSRDGLTAALRVHIDILRLLSAACTGPDGGGTGRTLADFVSEADAATEVTPDPFYRTVDILWRRPAPALPSLYCQNRIFRVNYNGRIRASGGVAFYGDRIVEPAWWPLLLPLHQTPVQAEYHAGANRDLIVVVA